MIRAGEGPRFSAERADFVATLLAAGPPHARRDIYVMEVEPGNAREADAHLPGSVEHVVVAAGRLPGRSGDATGRPRPGRLLSFPGDVPHHYQALEPGTWAVLVMEHR